MPYTYNTMPAHFLPQDITLLLAYLSASQFLTPCEINLLLNPPYILTRSLEDLLDPNQRQRNNSTTPPRPKNSFIIFRKNFEGFLRESHPGQSYNIQTVSRLAGEEWSNLPDTVKKYFDVLAKLARLRHKIAYPNYTYRPRQRRQLRRVNCWLFKEVNKDMIMR